MWHDAEEFESDHGLHHRFTNRTYWFRIQHQSLPFFSFSLATLRGAVRLQAATMEGVEGESGLIIEQLAAKVIFLRLLKNARRQGHLPVGRGVFQQSARGGEPEMNGLSRIQREEAVLVVVDVQDALMKKMNPGVGEKVIRNIRILLAFARHLAIPVLITEQYPKGLGPTVSEIKVEMGSILPIEKVSFSCCGVETFNGKLNQTGRKQVILVGIETHVCILQTADDLIQAGREVHAVADAICSQRKLDWEVGLRWMEKKGAMISTTEIIAFQLLKEAGTEEFRALSKWLK